MRKAVRSIGVLCLSFLNVLTGGCVTVGSEGVYPPLSSVPFSTPREAEQYRGYRVFTKDGGIDQQSSFDGSSNWVERTRKRVSKKIREFLKELDGVEERLKKQCTVPKTGIKLSISARDVYVGDILRIVAEKAKVGIVLMEDELESALDEIASDQQAPLASVNSRLGGQSRASSSIKKISVFYNQADLADILNNISETAGVCFDFTNKSIRVRRTLDIQIPFPFIIEPSTAQMPSQQQLSTGGQNRLGPPQQQSFQQDMSQRQSGNNVTQEVEKMLSQILGKDNVLLNARSGYLHLRGDHLSLIKAIKYLKNLSVDSMDYYTLYVYILRINSKKANERGVSFKDLINFYGHGLNMSFIPGGTTTGTSDEGTIFSLRRASLQALISFIEKYQIGEIISSPFVAVRSNSTAVVDLTSQIGWVEPGDYETTMNQTTTVGTMGKPTFQSKDVGLRLSIHVKSVDDSRVQAVMNVDATELDSFITSTWQPNKDVKPIELKYPLLTRRAFTTEILASLGEYVMFGGFREQRISDQRAGIPGVSNAPVIGTLLSSRNRSEDTSDLYIILGFEPIHSSDDLTDVFGSGYHDYRMKAGGVRNNIDSLYGIKEPHEKIFKSE
ncbi:MAG: hypothetical protein QXO76_00310 [Thermoproteota archaeon]